MNREKVENVLLTMGVPAGVRGFNYIVDAIEIFYERGTNISITKELYPEIAKKNNTTPTRAERAIRHAFDVARSSKGDYDVVEKYIGFMNCENSSSLKMLYVKLKQDCKEENCVEESGESESNKRKEITPLELQEIIREELRTFLNELKGMHI